MRTVSNYCFFLCIGFVLVVSSWFIQSASAQAPTGTLELIGPTTLLEIGDDFEVGVKLVDPENVNVFSIFILAIDGIQYNGVESEYGSDFTYSSASINGNPVWGFNLGVNINEGANPNLIPEGILFTATFRATRNGRFQLKIYEAVLTAHPIDNTSVDVDNIDPVAIFVGSQGTVRIAPAPGIIPPEHLDIKGICVGETSFVDIELTGRLGVHHYEITVDPSENLGSLTVSYNADDSNGTAITNHIAGAPITLRANLWETQRSHKRY